MAVTIGKIYDPGVQPDVTIWKLLLRKGKYSVLVKRGLVVT